jgi:hypothetical protein
MSRHTGGPWGLSGCSTTIRLLCRGGSCRMGASARPGPAVCQHRLFETPPAHRRVSPTCTIKAGKGRGVKVKLVGGAAATPVKSEVEVGRASKFITEGLSRK